jgi:hypothetical protein
MNMLIEFIGAIAFVLTLTACVGWWYWYIFFIGDGAD